MMIPVASQIRLMAIAIDIMHKRDPSNKMRPQLQLKKTEVRLF